MVERDFAIALQESLRKGLNAVCWRPSDGFTLGLPDIMAVLPPYGRFMALEAKTLSRLLIDAYDPGKRTGPLLHHAFQGPQIAMMDRLDKGGAYVRGVIRLSKDTACVLDTKAIQHFAEMGNPTFEELVRLGSFIQRTDGLWVTWPPGFTRDDRIPA